MAYIGGIVRREGSALICIGGMPDHVHMMIKMKPVHSLSDLMQRVKGKSSRWINEKRFTPSKFYWQAGFGGFSVSESQIDIVKAYIRNQERHHKQKNFKDEFVEILKKHKLDYDSDYIWE